MLGGENVGTAYVRILADGSGLDKSIRDEFRDSEDTFEGIGNRDSKAYKKAFAEGINETDGGTLSGSLVDALARNDLLDNFIHGRNWTRFRAGLTRQYGEVGSLAGKRLEEGLVEGMSFETLESRIKNLTREIAQSTREIMAEENRKRTEMEKFGNELAAAIHKESLEQRLEMDREFEENAARLHEEAMKDRQDRDRDFMANHNRLAAQAAEREKQFMDDLNEAYRINAQLKRKDNEQIAKTKQRYADLIFLIDRMNKGLKVDAKRHDLSAELDNISDSMTRLGLRTKEVHFALRDHERDLFLMHPTVNKVNRVIDDFSDGFGRAFGKGSRNDFLNFVGSIAGGATRLLKLIPAVGTSLWDFVQRARLSQRQGTRGGFFGSMAIDVTKLAGAITGGLGVAFALVGPMISILSQLAGVVIALASNLSFTLVGSAGAAAGALLPLVAGLGVAAAGFANLEGDAKKAAKGIVEEFKGLGEAAAAGLTMDRTQFENAGFRFNVRPFEEQMRLIRGMVSDLGPLTQQIGQAMGYAIDVFIDRIAGANGPWTQFIDHMTEGNRLATHSRIAFRSITEAFGGLLGMLRGLMPAGREFLEWLRDTMTRFNEWANSAGGQNQIQVFMENALESTRDFGTFLDATWDLLREFLNAGRTTGDSLFVSMAEQLDKWTTALRKDPEILQRWFRDSEEFAEALGNMVIGIGKVADALDNEWSRSLATGALELFADAVGAIGDSLRAIADVLGISENKVFSFGGQVAAAALILPRLSNALLGTRGSFTGFIGNMRTAETRMGAMRSAAGGLAGAAGLGLLIAGTQQTDKHLGTLMTTLGGAATGFAVGGPWGAAIGGAAGLIGGLVVHFRKTEGASRAARIEMMKTEGFKNAKEDANRLRESLVGVVSAYGETTRAAVEASFTGEDGKMERDIAQLRELGISMDTIVSATLGNAEAQGVVSRAIGEHITVARQARDEDRAAFEEAQANYQRDIRNGSEAAAVSHDIMEQRRADLDRSQAAVDDLTNAERILGRRTEETSGAIRDHRQEMIGLAKDLGIPLRLYKQFPKNIRTRFESRGLPQTAADAIRLVDQYKSLQNFKRIRAVISAPGVELTRRQVEDLGERYNLTPKEVKTLLRVEGLAKLLKDNKNAQDALDDTDKKRPKPKMDLEKGVFDRGINAGHSALTGIGGRVVSPKINVQSDAAAIAADTARILNNLSDEIVYIRTVRKGAGGQVAGYDGPAAAGGLFTNDTIRLIAEAGPEAVVPLNRPLDQVDPSVRYLSAIAQGKAMASGGVIGAGKTVNVGGMTVLSNSDDPETVAVEVLNRLVASAY